MATYLVQLTIEARDKRDAEHWAEWVANFESVMREVHVVYVRPKVKSFDDRQER